MKKSQILVKKNIFSLIKRGALFIVLLTTVAFQAQLWAKSEEGVAQTSSPTIDPEQCHDGENPYAGVIFSLDKKRLYGTANSGGYRGGTVFEFGLETKKLTTLYRFTGGLDGSNPQGILVLSKDGSTLYGTTFTGGIHGYGTIFSINLETKKLTTLHRFEGESDGAYPQGGLVLSRSGSTLYGTTIRGGIRNLGTVFAFNIAKKELTTLHRFTGGDDGAIPTMNVCLSSDGSTLYGTTTGAYMVGGLGEVGKGKVEENPRVGTFFSIQLATKEFTNLYTVVGKSNSEEISYPGPILGQDGSMLYGIIQRAQKINTAIYSFNVAKKELTVLYQFKADFIKPEAKTYLALSPDRSKFYGISCGIISGITGIAFEFDLASKKFSLLYRFPENAFPFSTPLLSQDGSLLYGTTAYENENGTIFSINLKTNESNTLHTFERALSAP